MNWTLIRIALVLLIPVAGGFATAADPSIRVFPINDHLLAFYDGRPAESTVTPGDRNWADFGAMNVGVATYVIHRGDLPPNFHPAIGRVSPKVTPVGAM